MVGFHHWDEISHLNILFHCRSALLQNSRLQYKHIQTQSLWALSDDYILDIEKVLEVSTESESKK